MKKIKLVFLILIFTLISNTALAITEKENNNIDYTKLENAIVNIKTINKAEYQNKTIAQLELYEELGKNILKEKVKDQKEVNDLINKINSTLKQKSENEDHQKLNYLYTFCGILLGLLFIMIIIKSMFESIMIGR